MTLPARSIAPLIPLFLAILRQGHIVIDNIVEVQIFVISCKASFLCCIFSSKLKIKYNRINIQIPCSTNNKKWNISSTFDFLTLFWRRKLDTLKALLDRCQDPHEKLPAVPEKATQYPCLTTVLLSAQIFSSILTVRLRCFFTTGSRPHYTSGRWLSTIGPLL